MQCVTKHFNANIRRRRPTLTGVGNPIGISPTHRPESGWIQDIHDWLTSGEFAFANWNRSGKLFGCGQACLNILRTAGELAEWLRKPKQARPGREQKSVKEK